MDDEKEFEFTQPNTLLPSVQISESQRREVDNMFNKDQEYKLDEAKQARLDAQRSSLRQVNRDLRASSAAELPISVVRKHHTSDPS